MNKCQRCRMENSETRRNCKQCGNELTRPCPICGCEINSDGYCPYHDGNI